MHRVTASRPNGSVNYALHIFLVGLCVAHFGNLTQTPDEDQLCKVGRPGRGCGEALPELSVSWRMRNTRSAQLTLADALAVAVMRREKASIL